MTGKPRDIGRRQFIASAVGAAAMAGSVRAALAEVKGDEIKFKVFSDHQAQVFSVWCDLLAPGASAAGVVQFVDKYLSAPYLESLLFVRFFQGAPLAEFYTAGLLGIDGESVAQFQKPFLDLTPANQKLIVDAVVASDTKSWNAPEAFFFYLVSRNDAVDVVYGTENGFQVLDIPYLAHISPDQPW